MVYDTAAAVVVVANSYHRVTWMKTEAVRTMIRTAMDIPRHDVVVDDDDDLVVSYHTTWW